MMQKYLWTVMLLACASTSAAGAQEKTPPSPTPQTEPAAVPAPPPAAAPAIETKPDNAAADTATQDAAAPAAAKTVARDKKGKEIYTGPANVVVLEPTPMLDEEGRQRLDPEGKPMFNPPVQQQRDKKGHPLFDDAGKPVYQTRNELGYDEKGKKLKAVKEKEPKKVSVSIEHGTLTVDGLTGKAGLNYEIADLRYIYLYAPWVGLTVVSNEPFPGATEEKNAFDDKTLTVAAGEHIYQLYSDKKLLPGKKPASAYVLVDRDFSMPVKFPVMGYGPTHKAPYAWPGSKEIAQNKDVDPRHVAPPLPSNLKPATALPPCPAGTMRPAATVPGQAAPPCTTIKGNAPAA